jgi:DNA polymerase I-like protein with 3'-5' exonuclease and polymerase domains
MLSVLFSVEVEMPALLCLARMELNGIGFNRDEAERLCSVLEQQLTVLEQQAYKLAGHTFSLMSSTDVGKVRKKCQIFYLSDKDAIYEVEVNFQTVKGL